MRVYYPNVIAVQEFVLDTAASSADSETGGTNFNMVPKEGGNKFSLYGTANYANSSLSAKAVSDEIIARGVGPQSSVKRIFDYGVGIGGPIRQDRAWFYTAHRWWGSENYGATNYFDKSTNPYQYVPDLSRPAYAPTYIRDNSVRVTCQATPKQKINQEEHLQYGCSCAAALGRSGLVSPDAASDSDYGPQVLSQTTWSYTASNRLLVQASATFLVQNVGFGTNTASTRNWFTFSGTPVPVPPDRYAITELTTGYTWGALPSVGYNQHNPSNNYNQRFAVSYVTGSHAFKAGVQTQQGVHNTHPPEAYAKTTTYAFRNGVPASLTEWVYTNSAVRLSNLGLLCTGSVDAEASDPEPRRTVRPIRGACAGHQQSRQHLHAVGRISSTGECPEL
jgi:hypothetical protein